MWMVAIDMVELDREVKPPTLTKFIISIVLHEMIGSFLIKIISLANCQAKCNTFEK